MSIRLKLLDTLPQVEKKIMKALARDLDETLTRAAPNIRQSVRRETRSLFQNTEIYEALGSGNLLALHFGFPSNTGQLKAMEIIEVILNDIQVEKKKVTALGGRLSGGLEIKILKNKFDDLLSLSAAMNVTRDGVFPWLEWLLVRGDDIIISEHEISMQPGRGRSGGAIMVKNTAGSWRVPPQFSGNSNDNWLTRALLDNADAYVSLLGKVVQHEIRRAIV